MKRIANRACLLAAAFAPGYLFSPAGMANSIDASSRSVKASAFCSSEFCEGNESNSATFDSPGLWNDGAGASVTASHASASQNTIISLGSTGGHMDASGEGGGDGGSWSADSNLEVTFTLDSATSYSLLGLISADGFGSFDGSVSALAQVKLIGPKGIVFLHEALANGFGGESSSPSESGELPAGTYTFSMRALANGFTSELSFGDGSALVELSLSLCGGNVLCPGDLNADRAVNGADLGLLLASWGETGGPGDLDCNGAIDGADLGILLSSWGPCD